MSLAKAMLRLETNHEFYFLLNSRPWAGAINFRMDVSRNPQVEADFSPDDAGFEMTR